MVKVGSFSWIPLEVLPVSPIKHMLANATSEQVLSIICYFCLAKGYLAGACWLLFSRDDGQKSTHALIAVCVTVLFVLLTSLGVNIFNVLLFELLIIAAFVPLSFSTVGMLGSGICLLALQVAIWIP